MATGQLVVDGAATKNLNARTLVVAAAGTWRAGHLSTGNGAQIVFPAGGSFDIQTNAILFSNQGGVRTRLQNDGVVTKSSGGLNRIDAAVDNRGLLQVLTSTLQLNGGGVSSGTFALQDGAVLEFGGQTHDLAAGSIVSGVGTVHFSSGTANLGGAMALSGTLRMAGATVNVNADGTADQAVIESGTLGADKLSEPRKVNTPGKPAAPGSEGCREG